jgi:hypothetical protein
MQKSQEDLVQMAFAGPDYEEDFAGVKRKAVDDELEVDEKKNQILSQGRCTSISRSALNYCISMCCMLMRNCKTPSFD